jgi:hypothetical protein
LFEGYDYTIRTAEKTFMTGVMFLSWVQNVFLPKVNHQSEITKYEGKVILAIDGQAAYVTPGVIASTGSQRLSLIRLMPHSSHIAQFLDLCISGLFKIHYFQKRKSKGMKGKT